MHVSEQRLVLQIVSVTVIVVAFLLASSQIITPYIAHDDLNFLMPGSWTGGYVTPWNATLTDGRWLNYLWYQVSMHLTPRSAYLLFFAAYLTLACTTTFNVTKSNLFGVCSLAIFFSPMFGHLSLWPSALFSGVVICGAATWLLSHVDARFAPVVVLTATLILTVAYPPLASIVLLVAAFREGQATHRHQFAIGAAYVIGFGFGVLAIYSLNLAVHGYFGVRVAPWRYPHPAHNLTELLANMPIYGQYWRGLVQSFPAAMICGAVAAVLLLYRTATRSRVLAILLAAALVCAIELGITLVTGTALPHRAVVWLWLVACLLCALVAAQPLRAWRYGGWAMLLALMFLGAGTWWDLYRQKQPTAQYEPQLAAKIRRHAAATGASDVIIMGNPRRVPELRGLFALDPIPEFRMAMLTYGIKTERCSVEFCAKARKYFESHPAHLLTVLDGRLVLVFDPHGHSKPVARNYPTQAEEAALKLSYPIFLRYGQASARITPFFPGTRERAVSVWLAPSTADYTLRSTDSACAFPVEYTLTSSSGERLATGELRGLQTVDLPRWNARGDDVSLSISMAAGAKNNYSCNLVVAQAEYPAGATQE